MKVRCSADQTILIENEFHFQIETYSRHLAAEFNLSCRLLPTFHVLLNGQLVPCTSKWFFNLIFNSSFMCRIECISCKAIVITCIVVVSKNLLIWLSKDGNSDKLVISSCKNSLFKYKNSNSILHSFNCIPAASVNMSTTSLASLNVDVLFHLVKFVDPVDRFNLILSGILKGFENLSKRMDLVKRYLNNIL